MKPCILLVLLALLPVAGRSCDACGCSVFGNGFGLLSLYRTNYLGWQWQSVRFRGTQATAGHPLTEDHFQSLSLQGRFQVFERWRLDVQQAYRWNYRLETGIDKRLSGLGDSRLIVNYVPLDNIALGAKTKLYLEAGAGLSLPIGRYQPNIHDNDLPDNFNTGKGSWGYLAQTNVIVTRSTFGLAFNAAYQHHGPTREDYRFGDEWSGGLQLFGQFTAGRQWQWMPFVGLNAEWVGDNHHANGNAVHGTGGEGYFVSTGANVKYRNWLLGASWSQPLHDHYSDGEVAARRRLSANLFFNF